MTTYNLNYDREIKLSAQPTKTFELKDNRINGFIDGMKALKQTITLSLITERYIWPIYSWQYGSELSTLIGGRRDFAESETGRMIQDALKNDDRIISIDNITFKYIKDIMQISFILNSVYGTEDFIYEIRN